jgi:hypothetical protein
VWHAQVTAGRKIESRNAKLEAGIRKLSILPGDSKVMRMYPHPRGVLYRCERKGLRQKGICKVMKTKEKEIDKRGQSPEQDARGSYVQDTPPRVFCKKRLDLLDSTGLNFFGSDKEAARDSQ